MYALEKINETKPIIPSIIPEQIILNNDNTNDNTNKIINVTNIILESLFISLNFSKNELL